MKKKLFATLVILSLVVCILVGCGKNEVDYSLEGDTVTGTDSTEESAEINTSSLEQFRNEMEWVEDLPVIDTLGEKHNIEIDTRILVPDLESMRVVESRQIGSNEEFKKQCMDSFFGADTEYYYHEEENYTKEELEKWLPDETEMIAQASDTHKVATEFESVSHYAGYREDILYEISLTDSLISIQPNWSETAKCGPEQFRDYKRVDFYENYLEGEENTCKYSIEEAQEIADNYMKEVGLSGMECTLSASATWCGNNTEVYDDNSADEYACYGYMFEYTTGLDGVSFSQFPEAYQFDTTYVEYIKITSVNHVDVHGGSPIDEDENISFGNGKARIVVTDDGIYSVNIKNAEVIENAGNSVGLLPLDTVKEIMREEITERTAKYNIANYRVYNHLQLMYLNVSEAAEETVMAVPVWCLSYAYGYVTPHYSHPLFVNAIDGTIVHFVDAEWAGVEATPEQLGSGGINEN